MTLIRDLIQLDKRNLSALKSKIIRYRSNKKAQALLKRQTDRQIEREMKRLRQEYERALSE